MKIADRVIDIPHAIRHGEPVVTLSPPRLWQDGCLLVSSACCLAGDLGELHCLVVWGDALSLGDLAEVERKSLA